MPDCYYLEDLTQIDIYHIHIVSNAIGTTTPFEFVVKSGTAISNSILQTRPVNNLGVDP